MLAGLLCNVLNHCLGSFVSKPDLYKSADGFSKVFSLIREKEKD